MGAKYYQIFFIFYLKNPHILKKGKKKEEKKNQE